jgi:2-oxoacid:acceptor oxidoreductase delta subunit (pyruvate/2-ketoisovalerate family)
MNEFLNNGSSTDPRLQKAIDRNEINFDSFKKIPSPEIPQISSERAIKGFKEVIRNVTEKELSKASSRCFSCGTCTECDICYVYCPDLSVKKISHGYKIDFDYCKGCAICAEECPRGVIHMVQEDS